MWAYNTGETEAVHYPLFDTAIMDDIHGVAKAAADCPDAGGRVSFDVKPGGKISVIEMMLRKVHKKRRSL
jgi:hypothetical protein